MKRLLKHSVLMLPSAYMTCLIQLRENIAKLGNGDCLFSCVWYFRRCSLLGTLHRLPLWLGHSGLLRWAVRITRPNVIYTRDWLEELLLLSTDIFLCVRLFLAWWHLTNNQVTLEQSCSWPLRRQSFAIFGIAHLSLPWSIGWVALSFLVVVVVVVPLWWHPSKSHF